MNLREEFALIFERYSFDQEGWNILPASQFGEVIDHLIDRACKEIERVVNPYKEASRWRSRHVWVYWEEARRSILAAFRGEKKC